jgi:hypothetical protein
LSISASGERLALARKTLSLLVPADAIIFNRNGMHVAAVNNGTAEFRKLKVKRDLGKRVEVDSGIKAGIRCSSIRPPRSSTAARFGAMPKTPRT